LGLLKVIQRLFWRLIHLLTPIAMKSFWQWVAINEVLIVGWWIRVACRSLIKEEHGRLILCYLVENCDLSLRRPSLPLQLTTVIWCPHITTSRCVGRSNGDLTVLELARCRDLQLGILGHKMNVGSNGLFKAAAHGTALLNLWNELLDVRLLLGRARVFISEDWWNILLAFELETLLKPFLCDRLDTLINNSR